MFKYCDDIAACNVRRIPPPNAKLDNVAANLAAVNQGL